MTEDLWVSSIFFLDVPKYKAVTECMHLVPVIQFSLLNQYIVRSGIHIYINMQRIITHVIFQLAFDSITQMLPSSLVTNLYPLSYGNFFVPYGCMNQHCCMKPPICTDMKSPKFTLIKYWGSQSQTLCYT